MTILRIHPSDSVAVALAPLKAGDNITENGVSVAVTEDIPTGHKVALSAVAKGEPVVKYGAPIGVAREAIAAGAHVHTHNLRTGLSDDLDYAYQPEGVPLAPILPQTFRGYVRQDGRVGIRNELWILPTVGCVSNVATRLERMAADLIGDGVEAVVAFPHNYGCSQMGEDQENTRCILADLATHPNAGGVLVLGLGCENSGVDSIRERMGQYDASRVRFLVCQEVEDEIEAAMAQLSALAEGMRADRREEVSADRLVVGLKCGGSDGFSGITANPVIGGFSDLLIAQGGSTILTEVPEMFGAETLLMARAESEAVFGKTVRLINDFKAYFRNHGQTIYENPSPGNKAGGISTLEDKALGCTQKSGAAPVVDVIGYGERVARKGLTLLSAPGNDLVAATALAAAGAQIVLFSTGRGTPFASPVPTIKIASNTELAQRKQAWIDFDAGRLLDGMTLPQLSEALMAQVLSVASGEQVQSERSGYHDMAIFKTGVTL